MNVTADSAAELSDVKTNLKSRFDMVELGPIKWLVGLSILCDRPARLLYISQLALIDTILEHFCLTNAHPVSTPLDPHVMLTHFDSPSTDVERASMVGTPYRELIRSLMYLALGSQPDIVFPVTHLSQFNADPGPKHWHAAQHVVHYLKGSCSLCLRLGGTAPLSISGFADFSFCGEPGPTDKAPCRFTSGYCFSLGSGMVSWNSKRQATTASLTCKAEYMAAHHAAKEALWLRSMFTLLDMTPTSASPIACDNQGALKLTKDQSFHNCVKHVDIDYHMVWDMVNLGRLSFYYTPTHENVADIFTKALPRPAFLRHHLSLGLIDLPDAR
jgi:Reverse transcriptase (RNA-dependent DNA polymerase)